MKVQKLMNNNFVVAVLALIVTLGSQNVCAQSTTAISGTYGCLLNTNFSGFNTYQNGHTSHISNIMILTLDASKLTSTVSGVSTSVKNYDMTTAYNDIQIFTSVSLPYEVNNPSAGIYKITDPSNTLNGVRYFIPVNSGNTLLLVRTPTSQPIENGVCHKV